MGVSRIPSTGTAYPMTRIISNGPKMIQRENTIQDVIENSVQVSHECTAIDLVKHGKELYQNIKSAREIIKNGTSQKLGSLVNIIA